MSHKHSELLNEKFIEWTDSKEGNTCLLDTILYVPSRDVPFLKNRLRASFMAGALAQSLLEVKSEISKG